MYSSSSEAKQTNRPKLDFRVIIVDGPLTPSSSSGSPHTVDTYVLSLECSPFAFKSDGICCHVEDSGSISKEGVEYLSYLWELIDCDFDRRKARFYEPAPARCRKAFSFFTRYLMILRGL